MAIRESTREETARVWRMTDVDDPANDLKRAESVYVTDTDTEMTDIAELIAGRLEVQLFAPRGVGLTIGRALASAKRLGLELAHLADTKWPNHTLTWTIRLGDPAADPALAAGLIPWLQPFFTESAPDVWECSAEIGRQFRATRLAELP